MIEYLRYIASYDDLCEWCNKNAPFDKVTQGEQLLEWTKNVGKDMYDKDSREITFNSYAYIAGSMDTKEQFIKDGEFQEDFATFVYIYHGFNQKLNRNSRMLKVNRNQNTELKTNIVFKDFYRLGNIIDAWYSKDITKRKACSFESMLQNCNNTFANFLSVTPPTFQYKQKGLFLDKSSNWWWCYFIQCYKEIYPLFNISLKHAIMKYTKGNLPEIDEGTCLIHFRTGDFLNHKEIFSIETLVNGIALFTKPIKKFEILHGGKAFSRLKSQCNELEIKSLECLNNIKDLIKQQYPDIPIYEVGTNNPDDDFFRMVMAPMLITGPGSYAFIAAAVNENERLSPSLQNANFVKEGFVLPETIYENWKTYI